MLGIIMCRFFCLSICNPKNVKIKVYCALIMPVALFGCENWSLILKKEHRLKVYENMVLRSVCGPKREEVKGES